MMVQGGGTEKVELVDYKDDDHEQKTKFAVESSTTQREEWNWPRILAFVLVSFVTMCR